MEWNAGDCWETFKGDGIPLWQIQIDHNAQRSITFRLRESFEDYLRNANATDTSLPTSVVDLEKVAGIRLVIGDQKDPEDVGVVQWRSVFYVAGDLNNFLFLFFWNSFCQNQEITFSSYCKKTKGKKKV